MLVVQSPCTMSLLPRVGKLVLSRTALLVCDIQEKFRSQIAHFDAITEVSSRMLQAAKILGIRTVITEMYPKVEKPPPRESSLGKTVQELGDLSGIPVIPKTAFSMYTDEVAQVLELGKQIDSVWLCGLETHVCVQATALDLVERGAQVHCIMDACSSRNMVDRPARCGEVVEFIRSRVNIVGSDLPEIAVYSDSIDCNSSNNSRSL
ncbi:unnamed protein product [Echinostoma caproni]|uniref:Isochorismatase domain-containing protein n=1 Tax=Echinostoma caproni TaxID=27848 RepID=A0A183B4P4_9TREM|nr:unnamed protein product [Echinostoma caproni]